MMMLPTLYYLFKYRTHAKSAMYLMLACSALATTVAAIFDTVTLLDRSNRFRVGGALPFTVKLGSQLTLLLHPHSCSHSLEFSQ